MSTGDGLGGRGGAISDHVSVTKKYCSTLLYLVEISVSVLMSFRTVQVNPSSADKSLCIDIKLCSSYKN